ncbi:MAG: DUF4390 domain-containing protein [Humidesulfovibrio sp.]|uniref:DUF4390 domain-containing protein n=1 Tax=Humidesulfovibrio sp. TaxID=2910988 RepID=UPI0027E7A8F9|nr:DUF4390 domain-containing protein [Humidesulfovibrio sp.]MDQ7834300.1 DUF4390 domain-containing protein [Humidesulfovibrio sp.]
MHRTRRTPKAAATAMLLATTLVLWTSVAAAQSLVLSNLVVDNKAGSLMARFGVSVDGVAELTESLQSGVTMALTCKAKLNRKSGLFGSPHLTEAESTSRLKFDALTKEYTLSLPGREAPLRNANLQDLLVAGWGGLTLGLGSWTMLERDKEYTLTLDIRLQQTDIPNWFRRTLLFWTWDVAPSASYQLHFKY